MVSRTRRRFLHSTAALLTGLAGCGQSPTGGPPTDSRPRGETVEQNFESYTLRNTTEKPPVWFREDRADSTTADATADTTAEPPQNARNRGFVASEESVGGLRFADVTGADEARQFVSDTDFDAETLFVESRPVAACRTLELCHVTWSDTDIDTQYGSYYRDADVACQTDTKEAVSMLIRIPEVVDPDEVRSYGSGWSSNGCQRRRPQREPETTDAPALGPATNATEMGDER